MRIPYVIDNQQEKLSQVLSELLTEQAGHSLDIASAYFIVGAFRLLRDPLLGLGSFRLLLGFEPKTPEHLGLRPRKSLLLGIRRDLEREPYTEETLRLVEDLIAYLRRDSVAVRLYDGDARFLHAKCYIVHSDPPGQQYLFDRFQPVAAIVGSSNFTAAGLCSNRELNVTHKVLLDPEEADDPEAADSVNWLSQERPSETIIQKNRQLLKSEVGARAIIELDEWYSRQWDESQDFCEDLIELLDASKFGAREYTPYEVYMKALYEYFRVDMENQKPSTEVRSAVDLAEFQESAVKKARRILSRYDGVMIADSVGLGKTWIGSSRSCEKAASKCMARRSFARRWRGVWTRAGRFE